MLSTLLAAAPLLAPAPEGTPYVQTVLQNGDTLSNGSTLLGVVDATIADSGSWAALVTTSSGRAVVRDGAVVVATGDTYFGDPVAQIERIELSRGGVLGVLYRTPGSNPALDSRLRIGPAIALDTGDPITYPPAGLSGTVVAMSGFDFEGDRAVVSLVYRSFIGVNEQSIVAGAFGGGGFTVTSGWKTGSPIAGLGADFETFADSLSAAPAGRYAAAVELESTGPDAHGVVQNGGGVAESGGPGPEPGTAWALSEAPRVALSGGDELLIAGTLALPGGGVSGAIYLGNQPVALEGATVNGVPGDPVAPFSSAAVDVADNGTPIFVLAFQSGRERLMFDSDVLVESGTSADPGTISSGQAIIGLAAASQGGRLDATSDGATIVLAGATFAGASLFLVERDIDAPVPCPVTVNSTGTFGRLRAEGSSYVAANDLTLVATALPAQQFTLLVASQSTQFVANPGGSQGNLCIGPTIGRFNGQVLASGAAGDVTFDVDLALIPQPSAFVAGMPGDTWFFQTWHRDVVGAGQTSNYTRAISVTLR